MADVLRWTFSGWGIVWPCLTPAWGASQGMSVALVELSFSVFFELRYVVQGLRERWRPSGGSLDSVPGVVVGLSR